MGCSRHVTQPLRIRAKINNSADFFIVRLRNDADSRYLRDVGKVLADRPCVSSTICAGVCWMPGTHGLLTGPDHGRMPPGELHQRRRWPAVNCQSVERTET